MASSTHNYTAEYLRDLIIDKIKALPNQPANSVQSGATTTFILDGVRGKKKAFCHDPMLLLLWTIPVGYEHPAKRAGEQRLSALSYRRRLVLVPSCNLPSQPWFVFFLSIAQ